MIVIGLNWFKYVEDDANKDIMTTKTGKIWKKIKTVEKTTWQNMEYFKNGKKYLAKYGIYKK